MGAFGGQGVRVRNWQPPVLWVLRPAAENNFVALLHGKGRCM